MIVSNNRAQIQQLSVVHSIHNGIEGYVLLVMNQLTGVEEKFFITEEEAEKLAQYFVSESDSI